MKRQILTILIGLIWASNLIGQVQNEVKEILANKDFLAFSSFADTLSNSEKRISSHWTILRDLTDDFKEGVFYFTKSVPDAKNAAISTVYTFRVRLLTNNKTIIYYELSEKRNRKIQKEWVPYYDTLDFYKNDSLFSLLRYSFNKSFDGELNETELFIDDLVYGQSCGIVGADPDEKIVIDSLVAAKNKEELFKWIKSTNLEKQIYAVDGLFQLKEGGITFTSKEIEIIKKVLSKKGTIYHCRGCVHSWKDVEWVSYKFKFE